MEYEILEEKIYVKALVQSESKDGAYYKVVIDGANSWNCTCPDYTRRNTLCKHVRTVKEGLGAYG